jgi:hypothetical protein
MGIPKQIAEITEQDLEALKAAVIREGKTIEYKERINIDSDDQKRKFVASIASFANAAGGDLVFGMQADSGMPKQIVPLQNFNPDRDIRTLRDMVRAHIDPPLFGVEFKEMPVQGGMALVVRVPRAWDGAHMVTYNNDCRFYTRDANGRVLMNVPEIRSSFTTTEIRADRIRRLRLERLSLIRSKELPVTLQDGAILVLHLFPMRSFEPGISYDLLPFVEGTSFQPMQVLSGWAHFHDLDGVYVADRMQDDSCRGYSAILRTGCIEVVQRTGPEKLIPNPGLESSFLKFFPRCVTWLRALGIEPPVIVMLSLLDIGGHSLYFGSGRFMFERRLIKHRDLILHDVFVQTFETPVAEILRPFCDSIWHACGLMRSFNFDEAGNWKPQNWE